MPIFRGAKCHRQRERGLSGADIAAQHDEIAAAKAAAEQAVERRKAGWNRIGHGCAIGDRIRAPKQLGEPRLVVVCGS